MLRRCMSLLEVAREFAFIAQESGESAAISRVGDEGPYAWIIHSSCFGFRCAVAARKQRRSIYANLAGAEHAARWPIGDALCSSLAADAISFIKSHYADSSAISKAAISNNGSQLCAEATQEYAEWRNAQPLFPSCYAFRASPAVASHLCELYEPPGFILGALRELERNCAPMRQEL